MIAIKTKYPINLLGFLAAVIMVFTSHVFALPVIPDGKGFGMETPAGRGGKIIRVTNLSSSGKGSLRAAIETSGPRVVVFEVSGNIVYKGRYKIKHPFITIAGQTAPSPGITLLGSTLTIDTHDILIQHIRVRPGDEVEGVDFDNRDAVNIGLTQPQDELYNIVVDHCSISWGVDENIESGNCSQVSWTNCIVSEPLSRSLHSKGEHSKAMMFMRADSVAVIGNIIAHSRDRNPVIQSGVKAVLANNLIYNPGDFNIRISSVKNASEISIVGNVTVKGKDSRYSAARKMPTIWKDPVPGTKIYLSDNRCHAGTQSSAEDWSFVRNATSLSDKVLKERVRVAQPPVWLKDFSAMPSSQVKEYLMKHAGARPMDRDEIDRRIETEIRTGKGRIINTPSEVGGWPRLSENKHKLSLPANPNSDSDGDGYTNLEEWLHKLATTLENGDTP